MSGDGRAAVVTGMGAVTPLGVGAEALVDGWLSHRYAVVDGVATCSEFDPLAHFDRKELRRIDRFTQFALAAGDEAIAQAGGADTFGDLRRSGCVIGTSVGGVTTMSAASETFAERPVVGELAGREMRSVPPTVIIKTMPNAAAGALALRHGLLGPCLATTSACAAGADAIALAVRLIRAGETDVVLAGGAESAVSQLLLSSFFAMDACSLEGISRPFDARRDGFVLGEGAAMLVLESEEHVAARGARPLGRILGHAATADAFHMAAPSPDGEGAARAMSAALLDAGIEPQDVDYINAHGSSTPLNDRAETLAIKAVFGVDAHRLPVSSTKSAIGHALGASGAIEAAATLLALNRRVVPPTLNYEVPDEGLDLDYVPRSRPLETRNGRPIAISNSFGFGGHNTVLCLAGAPTATESSHA